MAKRVPRPASTYRAGRRNEQLREDHGVWVPDWHGKPPAKEFVRYIPMAARGTAAKRIGGKAYPEHRVPTLRYPPNGRREVARRMRQMEARHVS